MTHLYASSEDYYWMLADSMKRLRLHLGKLVHETIINLALLQQALLAIPSPGKLITANTFSWQHFNCSFNLYYVQLEHNIISLSELHHASAALGTERVTFETIPQLLHHASATLGTVTVTFETIPQFQLLRLTFVCETKMMVLLTRGCCYLLYAFREWFDNRGF